MFRYKKLREVLKSKKAAKPLTDPLKKNNTPYDKQHKGKVPRGKFHGKRWFPQ
jgi:hypothetical protein